jgi:hypothetical protein
MVDPLFNSATLRHEIKHRMGRVSVGLRGPIKLALTEMSNQMLVSRFK